MHVGLGINWNVVVNHVRHARHINTPGCNVGCHQNVENALFQLANCLLAQLLRHVTVDCTSPIASSLKLLSHFDGRVFGSHEHHQTIEVFNFQNTRQGIQLVGALDHPKRLLNGIHHAGLGFNRDFFGLVQILISQTANRLGHSGTEQGHLTLFRCVFQNPSHVINKAHAQHLIGFVQDYRFQCV